MAKKRNIESASMFERSGIRAIRARAIEVLLYKVCKIDFNHPFLALLSYAQGELL